MISYFGLNMIQYICILCFMYGTLVKKKNNYKIIQKYDTHYQIMENHYYVSKYVKSVIRECKMNMYQICNLYQIPSLLLLQSHFIQNLQYVYFFRSKNLLVYFFQKHGENDHKVYFEGVNELGDLRYLSFPNQWFNEYTLKSIRENLTETGFLYQINCKDGVVHRVRDKIRTIFRAFSHMNHHYYQKDKCRITMEGYSMGGVLSQIFTYLLLKEKYIQEYHLKIDLYIIESWWGGSKEFYEYLSSSQYIQIKNVMCLGSILYYYNLFFQKFFPIDKYVEFRGVDMKSLFKKYMVLPFPFGITEYFGDHHYISRFMKYVKSKK